MRIATWNVNSLKVRLPQVIEYLQKRAPDILALQETKMQDDQFPEHEFRDLGYHALYAGQPTYNGVAILSRLPPVNVVTEMPELHDPQKRYLEAEIGRVRVVNLYVPNGQEVGSEKYAYKMRWLSALKRHLRQALDGHERLVVLGDFNIAPADVDVHDPDRWRGHIMCSEEERAAFSALLNLGLVDVVRSTHPDKPMFTWWDYRMGAYRRGWGLRIDHILTTPALKVLDAGVDEAWRRLPRPSDHAPVWVELEGNA